MGDRRSHVILGDRKGVLAVERHAPGDRLIEDDAEAVDVGGRHQRPAEHLFGADVIGRARRRLLCEIGPALGLLEARVDDDDAVVGRLDDRGGLDGSVDYALLVEGAQTERCLSAKRGRRVRRKGARDGQHAAQVCAPDGFRGQRDELALPLPAEHALEVWTGHPGDTGDGRDEHVRGDRPDRLDHHFGALGCDRPLRLQRIAGRQVAGDRIGLIEAVCHCGLRPLASNRARRHVEAIEPIV